MGEAGATGEKKLSRLTFGPLFPDPGSGEEVSVPAQFSHRGSSAWEHGDFGQPLMSLLLPDCLQMTAEVLHSYPALYRKANFRSDWTPFWLLCALFVCLQHADCADKIQPTIYLLGNSFCLA